jgi:aminoglycoside/choline kinase family phosphotransferase
MSFMVTDTGHLPITLEEITPEWMTFALRTRAPGVRCEGLEIVDVMKGTCTKIRVKLDMDRAGSEAKIPEYVMIKGGFEPHSRTMGHMHQLEVRAYREVLPFLELPSPACYFAGFDEERQQGIVILEDLTQRGVEFCSALRPQTFKQVQRQLSALARFHAQGWESPELKEGGRWADLSNAERELREYVRRYLDYPDEWQRFVQSPRGASTSVHLHDLHTIIAAYDKLCDYSATLPHCVLHGDTHLGNLYIQADGTPGFLDVVPGYGPAMRDVTYHITSAIDIADRRRWDKALIQHYLSELAGHGVSAPSFDEALEQFKAFLLIGHVVFMINESFYQPEAINTACSARYGAAMVDYDTLMHIDRLV